MRLNPGAIYEIDDANYEIITAVAGIVDGNDGSMSLSKPVFILENTTTKERKYLREDVLKSKLSEANRNE